MRWNKSFFKKRDVLLLLNKRRAQKKRPMHLSVVNQMVTLNSSPGLGTDVYTSVGGVALFSFVSERDASLSFLTYSSCPSVFILLSQTDHNSLPQWSRLLIFLSTVLTNTEIHSNAIDFKGKIKSFRWIIFISSDQGLGASSPFLSFLFDVIVLYPTIVCHPFSCCCASCFCLGPSNRS